MEKVAASKMKKTQDRMERGRPYRNRMLEVIGHLANGQPEYKPTYMVEREPKNIAIIVINILTVETAAAVGSKSHRT